MKLSEAIKLGAMLGSQLRGKITRKKDQSSCALGSALMATGKGRTYLVAKSRWPWIQTQKAYCPQCNLYEMPVINHITHLNDNHLWTRECIADWIASIEPQQEELALPTVPIREEAQETIA